MLGDNKRAKPRLTGVGRMGWLLLACLWLAACGPAAATATLSATPSPDSAPNAIESPAAATATPEPTQSARVNLWVDWRPQAMLVLESLLAEYKDLHPGAQIELVYVRPQELRPAFEQAAAEGGGPTMFIGPSEWGIELYQAGLIRDVGQLVLPEQRAAIHSLAWTQVDRLQATLGLPFGLQGTVLYRNTILAPQPADTVESLLETAGGLRARNLEGGSFDLGFVRSAPLLRTCKGELVPDVDVDPVERPAGLCWLRLLNRLGSAGTPVFDSNEDFARFTAGESAWLLESSEALAQLRQALGQENVTVDSWPLYLATGESMTGYVWTDNLYFSAAAGEADLEASWALAAFLLAPENQAALRQASGMTHLPPLRDDRPDDTTMMLARRALDGGVPLPDFVPLELVRRELETAVRLVVGQGSEPELALDLALEEIRRGRIPTATPTRTASPTTTPTITPTSPPTPPPG